MSMTCGSNGQSSRPWKKCKDLSSSDNQGKDESRGQSKRRKEGQGQGHSKGQGKGQGNAQGKDVVKAQRTAQTKVAVKAQPLRDLTAELVKSGMYEEYRRWREGYRRWREGEAAGASGEGCSATTDGPMLPSRSWRDDYRNWRQGGLKGAHGEVEMVRQRGESFVSSVGSDTSTSIVPPVVYDVVAGLGGKPALVPSEGPQVAPMLVKDFPPEAVLTIRVIRFFEDRSDEKQPWEKGLRNVNSGSIFWLPVQLEPEMHSKAGAKYGSWFVVHYVQVLAKHFASSYQMCNEGFNSGAKTFGSSSANSKAITGQPLPEGYFWYVSPAKEQEDLRSDGWQHLDRAGPFDGDAFLKQWHERGSAMDVRVLQDTLAKVMEDASPKKLE